MVFYGNDPRNKRVRWRTKTEVNNNDNWFRARRANKNVTSVDEAFNGSKNRLSVELPVDSFVVIHTGPYDTILREIESSSGKHAFEY